MIDWVQTILLHQLLSETLRHTHTQLFILNSRGWIYNSMASRFAFYVTLRKVQWPCFLFYREDEEENVCMTWRWTRSQMLNICGAVLRGTEGSKSLGTCLGRLNLVVRPFLSFCFKPIMSWVNSTPHLLHYSTLPNHRPRSTGLRTMDWNHESKQINLHLTYFSHSGRRLTQHPYATWLWLQK